VGDAAVVVFVIDPRDDAQDPGEDGVTIVRREVKTPDGPLSAVRVTQIGHDAAPGHLDAVRHHTDVRGDQDGDPTLWATPRAGTRRSSEDPGAWKQTGPQAHGDVVPVSFLETDDSTTKKVTQDNRAFSGGQRFSRVGDPPNVPRNDTAAGSTTRGSNVRERRERKVRAQLSPSEGRPRGTTVEKLVKRRGRPNSRRHLAR